MAFRILIVDDNELMRNALKSLLSTGDRWELCGEAANGAEAIDKVAELEPDLVVLDLVMPGMDGLQAARAISTMALRPTILLHTWHATPAIEEEARKNGVHGVVSKSVGTDNLVSVIEAVFQERIANCVTLSSRKRARRRATKSGPAAFEKPNTTSAE